MPALERIAYLLRSNSRLRSFVSVRSAALWFDSVTQGLIIKLRILTTEAQSSQRREIYLMPALEKNSIFASEQ